MRGITSDNPSRIIEQEIVTSPVESLEALSSSLGGSTLECSVSSSELVKRSRDSAMSRASSFFFVEADQDDLDPKFDSQPPAIPLPTEEEEFLAGISEEMDEFGV
jgi:hypothetical protein